MVAEVFQRDILALSISSAMGGSERSLLEFAGRARDNDIALEVALPGDGPLATALSEKDVHVSFLEELVPLLHLSQQPGRLDWQSFVRAPFGFRTAGKAIARLAARRTVYSNSFKTHLAAAAGGVRCLWHVREFPPTTTGIAWGPICARAADTVVANSRAVGQAWNDLVEPLASEPPPVEVVYNGVDTNVFQPGDRDYNLRQRLAIPPDSFVFGMPAAFASWKGHLEVLQAFETVAGLLPNTYLVFVGGEIYDTTAETAFGRDLERRIESEGSGRVFRIGFTNDIAPLYREFDCTVHYSLRPEPFGRVLIESMASGVPVIAADEGGPVEILTRSPLTGGGWLCAPRSSTDLASMFETVAAMSRAELDAVGEAGRARSLQTFDAAHYAASVAEILLRS